MPTPGGSAVVTDVNGVPAAQSWDNTTGTYFYIFGDSVRAESFARQAPIVPAVIGSYASGLLVKATAGTFFGASGQYKGSVNAWIMVFNNGALPSNGTVPFAATAVGPISGTDINWSIIPRKPYLCAGGIYIALSSTGGTFTASSNTDLTGTIEFI